MIATEEMRKCVRLIHAYEADGSDAALMLGYINRCLLVEELEAAGVAPECIDDVYDELMKAIQVTA